MQMPLSPDALASDQLLPAVWRCSARSQELGHYPSSYDNVAPGVGVTHGDELPSPVPL